MSRIATDLLRADRLLDSILKPNDPGETMKVTTDTAGTTRCELSTQDRKTLAAAKTIAEQLAFHERGTEPGAVAKEIADEIKILLTCMHDVFVAGEEDEAPAE